MFLRIEGSPNQMGKAYGSTFVDRIRQNLSILVWREGYDPLPREDADFASWLENQERLIGKAWPWLLDEMNGVARAVGAQYEDILLLNLRAWQYQYYWAKPEIGACSSLAITLEDGSIACAGALDDPIEYYCGPVHYVPENGFSFITFPIAGTSWATRGMNSEGLAVGISSQLLPGLRRLDNVVNQDLAVRAMLQTCSTTGRVREFCREYPFTMNLVCVDVQGDILCAHNTSAGLLEMPVEGYCVLTNHVADDGFIYWLEQHGVSEFPDVPTSRQRRGNLLCFARERNGLCSAEEVMGFICRRDDANPGSVNHKGSIYLTFANPMSEKSTFRILETHESEGNGAFKAYSV